MYVKWNMRKKKERKSVTVRNACRKGAQYLQGHGIEFVLKYLGDWVARGGRCAYPWSRHHVHDLDPVSLCGAANRKNSLHEFLTS
jgi:hypothetical protein